MKVSDNTSALKKARVDVAMHNQIQHSQTPSSVIKPSGVGVSKAMDMSAFNAIIDKCNVAIANVQSSSVQTKQDLSAVVGEFSQIRDLVYTLQNAIKSLASNQAILDLKKQLESLIASFQSKLDDNSRKIMSIDERSARATKDIFDGLNIDAIRDELNVLKKGFQSLGLDLIKGEVDKLKHALSSLDIESIKNEVISLKNSILAFQAHAMDSVRDELDLLKNVVATFSIDAIKADLTALKKSVLDVHATNNTDGLRREVNALKGQVAGIDLESVKADLNSLRGEVQQMKMAMNRAPQSAPVDIHAIKSSVREEVVAQAKADIQQLKQEVQADAQQLKSSVRDEAIAMSKSAAQAEVQSIKKEVEAIKAIADGHTDIHQQRLIKQKLSTNELELVKVKNELRNLNSKGVRPDNDALFTMLRDVKREVQKVKETGTLSVGPAQRTIGSRGTTPASNASIEDLRKRLEHIESMFKYDENGGFLKIGPECNMPKQNDPAGKAGVWSEAPTSLLISGGVVLNNFGYREKRDKKHKLLCVDNTTGKLYLVQNE